MPKSGMSLPVARFALVVVSALAMVAPAPAGRPSAQTPNDRPVGLRAEEILKSAAAYCERVKSIALHFVCRERIIDVENEFKDVSQATGLQREERIFDVGRVRRHSFCYDYQLIKKGEDLVERRTLLEDNGRKKHQENADLGHLKYSSRYLVYGPVGFLSRYWQTRFTYSFSEGTTEAGEPAVVIQAAPNEMRVDNLNSGRIWINQDFQVLRVEWEPASIRSYQPETLGSRLGEFLKTVAWTVDYGVEKNGVRFPSRQVIREFFVQDSPDGVPRKALKRETRFDYDQYKFFIVETEVRYEKGPF